MKKKSEELSFVVKGKERNLKELEFSSHLASGPGGQNVQKTATAVLLRFNVVATESFSEYEKNMLLQKLSARLTKEGDLLIKSQTERSWLQNRNEALQKLVNVLEAALFVPKIRKKTKPTKNSQRRRLDSKTRAGKTKALRQKVR